MTWLQLNTIVVDRYGPAIEFFVGALGSDLADDPPSLTNDGQNQKAGYF